MIFLNFTRFFSLEQPKKADADGLIACLQQAVGVVGPIGENGILDKANVLKSKPILIGGGTDGASVNVGNQNGMMAKMQRELPWLFWSWCYAHRLELACKGSFTSNLFSSITEMLLRLYSLYSKSPKKLRELADLVSDLKEVFEFPEGGNAPIRSEGSRWISHKRQALQRIIERYGAYISHLTTLVEDSSISNTDKTRLKGYLSKWQQGKLLIGCAFYVDALKAPSMLSKVLQAEKLDIVSGLQNIIKSKKSLKSLVDGDPLEWPTVKLVRNKIKNGNEYQGVILKHFDDEDTVLEFCKNQASADVLRLEEKMRERLEWSDIKLMRAILVFLDTQTWRRRHVTQVVPASQDSESGESDSENSSKDSALNEVLAAVDSIATVFKEPLQASGVCLLGLQDEMEEVVEYARQYLSIESEKYHKVWYNLHICADSSKWANILVLCELCFSLPFSNGTVERMFSCLKLIKTDHRTRLNCDTLNNLMETRFEGPSLARFSAEQAVELWWEDCKSARRPNQSARKPYTARKSARKTEEDTSESSASEPSFSLSEWDTWFSDTNDSDE